MISCEPIIKPVPLDTWDEWSPEQQSYYLRAYREQVAPRFEEWRNPHRIKCAHGGRGAGAKSRSAASLLVQFGENPSYFGESIRVLCVREVQKSIKESSWLLLKDTIHRLDYGGWEIQETKIINRKNGSYYIFNGLNDMTESDLKSYESFDILFAEEGAPITKRSWNSIIPTFRKLGSEIWCLFNRSLTTDPCYDLFCVNPEPDWAIINCRPGPEDNPWWYDSNLPNDWKHMQKNDPIEFQHVFLGYPRPQGDRAIFSRSQVLDMISQERIDKVNDKGAIEIGCDVARFGKDKSQAYKRKGLKVIQHEERTGFDTVEVAGMLWDMAERNKEIKIKVDVGYNPGVVDLLHSWGANVVPIGFGETAVDEDNYANAATEMFFKFPIDEVAIPPEMLTTTLFEDMTERYYIYDTAGRKKIEPKDGTSIVEGGTSKANFKGRHGGRSPDEGDALFLTFYSTDVSWSFI
jgi:hypothetical protein